MGSRALTWGQGTWVLCQAQELLSWVTLGRFLDFFDVLSVGNNRAASQHCVGLQGYGELSVKWTVETAWQRSLTEERFPRTVSFRLGVQGPGVQGLCLLSLLVTLGRSLPLSGCQFPLCCWGNLMASNVLSDPKMEGRYDISTLHVTEHQRPAGSSPVSLLL